MARPLRENRDEVADVTLTIRITGPERAALDTLVARRAAQLGELGGSVSAASVVRALIRQAVQAEVGAPSPKAQAPAKGKSVTAKPTSDAKVKSAPAPTLDGDSLRARFLAARDAGRVTGADVAQALRLSDGSVISRWSKGQPLPAKHWSTVDGLLRQAGF